MKITALIARCLLGFVFLVFGSNGFGHFLPMPPMTGLALQCIIALSASHFMVVVFLLQVISGILLLIGRYVPLGLTLLAPVLVCILLFHLCMAPSGLPMPVILGILWCIVFYRYRAAFAGIFQSQVPA